MAPIDWEGTSGSTTKVGDVQYEPTPGVLNTIGEAWYENPAGVLSLVHSTTPPIYQRMHAFTGIPGSDELLVLQDANPANYFDSDSRRLLNQQNFDTNAEGTDVVPEGVYRVSAAGANIGGSRITGLHNRGPAGIAVMPNGDLIYAAGGGDLQAPDTTIFNRYTLGQSSATNPQRINFYHRDPRRNQWHNRVLGNELSQIEVRSGTAVGEDRVAFVFGSVGAPPSTYRFSRPATIPSLSTTVVGLENVWRAENVRGGQTDIPGLGHIATGDTLSGVGLFGTTGEVVTPDGGTITVHELTGSGMFELSVSYSEPGAHWFLDRVVFLSFVGVRTVLGVGTRPVNVGQSRYILTTNNPEHQGERIMMFDMSTDPARVLGSWQARTQEGAYRLPQITGVTSDGTDLWFCGNFSGIVGGGLPRNGGGEWGIWKVEGDYRPPDAFSPYTPSVWLRDLHYVSPTKILVLCESVNAVRLPDGSNNRLNFVTSFNPTTNTFDDSDDFVIRL